MENCIFIIVGKVKSSPCFIHIQDDLITAQFSMRNDYEIIYIHQPFIVNQVINGTLRN